MLFNKKPQDEFSTDFSTSYSSEPRPVTYRAVPNDSTQMPASRKSSNVSSTRSVIDSWLTIRGDLESEGEVQIDGKVNGDIRCAHLVVGKDATVVGNIIAEEVIVRGKVKGIIRAISVTLQDTAVVESEIFHKSIAIEQGACFDGLSRRRDEPMKADVVELQADKPSKSKKNGLEHGPHAAA
ncbi:MAG TPA: polymer-forming cytoskeletal protein [Hyphomicrobiaceae bacterium]|nr:polymer-forming cytoskeletal protein [Hyphomicrobiaceae bacterium]